MLASQSQDKIEQFDPQNIQNVVWSFAKLGHRDMPLYKVLSVACINRISEFSVQDVTGTAWGFATCALQSSAVVAPLVETLGLGAAQRLTQFAVRDIAGTFWAMAKLESGNRPLMDLISCQALNSLMIREFKPQDCSVTVWAMAHLAYVNSPFLLHLVEQVLAQIHRFGSQDISNSA
ncbi:unnamed protein product [Cladocopium goreaui]|uniref:RNA-editing substrate-binding complex 6 protein domain-containing protein n=1 Tax=Cladocopium goreaui TaxID=2562237 RepID=A0A9P1GB85_9DINO|nr:unnamed protein product [Cladocopium goreaui]